MLDPIENKTTGVFVTNPISALTEIFIKPRAVFDALSVKENWSWLPFILLSTVLFFPSYLYFAVVDFEWWRQVSVEMMLGDVSPAEKQNLMNAMNLQVTQWSAAIMTAVVYPIIGFLVFAAYYTFITRNDGKSVQGFTDWFGAMWWMALPSIFNALLALVLLTFTDTNAQVSDTIISPLSLAYLLNISTGSAWYALVVALRIDVFWTIYLGYVALCSWTEFTPTKAVIAAASPLGLYVLISVVWIFVA